MSDTAVTIVERHPSAVVVRVQPERFDENNLPAVCANASAAGAEAPELPVLLDLTKVHFMPSLSLGGLVQLLRDFKARGQRLVLTGLQPIVRDTMAITRLDRLFEIQDDASSLLK
jgi:anti-anti-sigma factor